MLSGRFQFRDRAAAWRFFSEVPSRAMIRAIQETHPSQLRILPRTPGRDIAQLVSDPRLWSSVSGQNILQFAVTSSRKLLAKTPVLLVGSSDGIDRIDSTMALGHEFEGDFDEEAVDFGKDHVVEIIKQLECENKVKKESWTGYWETHSQTVSACWHNGSRPDEMSASLKRLAKGGSCLEHLTCTIDLEDSSKITFKFSRGSLDVATCVLGLIFARSHSSSTVEAWMLRLVCLDPCLQQHLLCWLRFCAPHPRITTT